jgi:hypothetical protein
MNTDQPSLKHPPTGAAEAQHDPAPRAARSSRGPIVLDGARFWGELTRANEQLDTARLSRDVAELGKSSAEAAQHAAEVALQAALREVAELREKVAFLEEQVRSTRAYLTDVMEASLAELRAERAALLQELGMLDGALMHDAELGGFSAPT